MALRESHSRRGGKRSVQRRRKTGPTVKRSVASKQVAPHWLRCAITSSGPMTPAGVQGLQPVFGNRAVARLVQPPSADVPIQAKLTVGPVGDPYEQEADRLAAQVVSQVNAPAPRRPGWGQAAQRQEEQEELQATPAADIQRQEQEEEVQMMPAEGVQRLPGGGSEMAAPPELEGEIQRARGRGQGLSDHVRTPMENAFGADFSGVRVHSGEGADALNRSLQAKAFTSGQDVFFREGEYSPGSSGGQQLIAHELTHVMQQTHVARKKTYSKNQTHGDRSGNRDQGNKEADEKEVEIHRHPQGDRAIQAKFGFELEFPIALEWLEGGLYDHPEETYLAEDVGGAKIDLHKDHSDRFDKNVVDPDALGTEGVEAGLPACVEVVTQPIDEFSSKSADQLQQQKDKISELTTNLANAIGHRHTLSTYAAGADGELRVGGQADGGQNTTEANVQATYGIRLDQIEHAFQRHAELLEATPETSGGRSRAEQYGSLLTSSVTIGTESFDWLKGEHRTVERASETNGALLRNFLILLAYNAHALRSYSGSTTVGKNKMGMFLYKSNLADVRKKLPKGMRNILDANADDIASDLLTRSEAHLTENQKGRLRFEDPVSPDELTPVLRGASDNYWVKLVDSTVLKPEVLGKKRKPLDVFGQIFGKKRRALGIIMENRQIFQLLDKPKYMTRADWEEVMDTVRDLLVELHGRGLGATE